MTRERIEDIREIVFPFVRNVLLKTNYENLGKSDAEEFTRDFNEILDLAIKALEQEQTTKNNLGVKKVTAFAELIAKLTKECEEAYDKGYADGMKACAENEGWIDPNTHRPPIGQDVLVKLDGGNIEIAYLTKLGDWREPGCFITHDFCIVKSWKLLC